MGPLAFALLLLNVQDLQEWIRRLGSEDAEGDRQSRRALTERASEAREPVRRALSDAQGKRADSLRFALAMIDARLALTPEVSVSYEWIEEEIAAEPARAMPALIRRMWSDRALLKFGPDDFRPVVDMALQAGVTGRDERVGVIRAIADLKLTGFGPKFLAWLDDPSDDVRQYAAFALVHAGGAGTAEAATKALADGVFGAEGRALATRVVAHLNHTQAAPVLARLLTDPDAPVRARAVEALGAIGAVGLAGAIVERLADESPDVRESAAAVLVQLKALDQLPAIAALLKEDSPVPVRSVALKTLAHLGDPREWEAVASLLKDRDLDLKREAIAALGRFGEPKAARPLLETFRSEPTLRAAAAGALSRLAAADVVPELVPLARDPDDQVRLFAASILTRCPVEPAIAMLGGSAADAEHAGRWLALGRHPDAPQALLKALETLPEERRSGALILLAEYGAREIESDATEAALRNSPDQADLLFALNGLTPGTPYLAIARTGPVQMDHHGDAATVIQALAKAFRLELVISDRCDPESLALPIDLTGLATAREAFSRLTRMARIAFIFDGKLLRAVPLEEALRHWAGRETK